MPVTELYAFNLICENLLAALCGAALKTEMNFYALFIGNIDPVYHYLCKSVFLFHRKLVPPVQRFDQRLGVNFLHPAFYQKKLLFVFIFLGMKLAYLVLNVPEKYIVRINKPVDQLFGICFNAEQL